MIRRLASLHWLLLGAVRQLHRYCQDAMTSCRSFRRASLPSLGGTSACTRFFAPRRTSAPPRPGVGNPVSPTGNIAEETTGSPKFLENPDCPFAHVQSTPVGLLTPDHCGAATWPLVCEKQRLPRKVFRRSIAWLSDWLSTLRGVSHPNPTQDSLPAAGQALPDGLYTRKVPTKGFKVLPYISFSFPKLPWRNHIDRRIGFLQFLMSPESFPNQPVVKAVVLVVAQGVWTHNGTVDVCC
jgi:hypothetical protein